MSYNEFDAAQDAAYEALYEEHKEEAISEFTAERLQSFYIENPSLAEPAVRALDEASKLFSSGHFTAAFIFAAIAAEVGLKFVLLKPVVYGLVHSDSAATLITELAVRHTQMDRFKTLLFQILDEHGNIDLHIFKRDGSTVTLWQEIRTVQDRRNSIVHSGGVVSQDQASQAIAIASSILKKIFPAVIKALDLHLHDGVKVCSDYRCESESRLKSIIAKATS